MEMKIYYDKEMLGFLVAFKILRQILWIVGCDDCMFVVGLCGILIPAVKILPIHLPCLLSILLIYLSALEWSIKHLSIMTLTVCIDC